MPLKQITLRLAAMTAFLAFSWHAQGWAIGPLTGEISVLRSREDLDLSIEFAARFSENTPTQSETLLNTLREYRILFVPGFLSNSSINAALLDKSLEIKRGSYFETQIAWLRAGGVDARIVDIESEESVVFNSKRITQSINRSPKPVIIVAHSKGGLDTLEALLADQALAEKVSGVIAIQSPFQGTLIADHLLSRWGFHSSMWAALTILRGSELSLMDLAVDTRERYQINNAAAITELTAQIPFICFGSWVDDDEQHLDSELALIRDYLLKRGLKNDGVVPLSSALLPGAYSIAFEGVDHKMTVKDDARLPFDRIKFLKTLMELLSARISGRALK